MPRGAPRTWDVDVDVLDLDELEERLRAAGQSARTTRSILSYVVLSQAGRKVEIPKASESRYRRTICEAYGIPAGPPPRNARRRPDVVTPLRARTAEQGAAKVRGLVAVAGLALVGLAGPQISAGGAPRSPSPAFEAPSPIIPVSRRSRGSEGRRAA